ncbi:hypothetical protein SHL15_9162 [Streptomyces hygroscopicus subsp. limoneus]|nr:hypothetical protein SHL15_9162 [Streptomyces hygroscopicus subsp. limoneus]
MTDLHEPWEPLDSYPDESPPPRQCGDVNLAGLLSIADDLARGLATLKIRVRPHDPKTSLVSPEKARENAAKEVDRLLGTAVHFRRHAPAAMLGRCILGADSKGDCSTEGTNLDPTKGYLNFVLCTEPQRGAVTSSLNAVLDIKAQQTVTPHFQEWLNRLVRCEPNAMHCTFVEHRRPDGGRFR